MWPRRRRFRSAATAVSFWAPSSSSVRFPSKSSFHTMEFPSLVKDGTPTGSKCTSHLEVGMPGNGLHHGMWQLQILGLKRCVGFGGRSLQMARGSRLLREGIEVEFVDPVECSLFNESYGSNLYSGKRGKGRAYCHPATNMPKIISARGCGSC
jgi:hypothetical protein